MVSSTRGDKGNPAARCALFRGVLERNAAVTASTRRSSRLSVCLSVTVSAARRHPLPGRVDFTSAPLVHRTHGVIRVSSVAVWLFTQPPGCCCCVVAVVSSLSLSVCLVYFRIQLHTRKSERQNRCVWLRSFMRRPSSSSSSVCSRLAVIVRSASETRCSPPTERRSLSLPPPRPPPRRPMERRGGGGSEDQMI